MIKNLEQNNVTKENRQEESIIDKSFASKSNIVRMANAQMAKAIENSETVNPFKTSYILETSDFRKYTEELKTADTKMEKPNVELTTIKGYKYVANVVYQPVIPKDLDRDARLIRKLNNWLLVELLDMDTMQIVRVVNPDWTSQHHDSDKIGKVDIENVSPMYKPYMTGKGTSLKSCVTMDLATRGHVTNLLDVALSIPTSCSGKMPIITNDLEFMEHITQRKSIRNIDDTPIMFVDLASFDEKESIQVVYPAIVRKKTENGVVEIVKQINIPWVIPAGLRMPASIVFATGGQVSIEPNAFTVNTKTADLISMTTIAPMMVLMLVYFKTFRALWQTLLQAPTVSNLKILITMMNGIGFRAIELDMFLLLDIVKEAPGDSYDVWSMFVSSCFTKTSMITSPTFVSLNNNKRDKLVLGSIPEKPKLPKSRKTKNKGENWNDQSEKIPKDVAIKTKAKKVKDEHTHTCFVCKSKYKHIHPGKPKHRQFDYECPNPDCPHYYQKIPKDFVMHHKDNRTYEDVYNNKSGSVLINKRDKHLEKVNKEPEIKEEKKEEQVDNTHDKKNDAKTVKNNDIEVIQTVVKNSNKKKKHKKNNNYGYNYNKNYNYNDWGDYADEYDEYDDYYDDYIDYGEEFVNHK